MGVITQSEFEGLLDQLKLEKEKLLPGQKLSLADFLKKNGYAATLNSIHFAVDKKTVTHTKMQNQDGSVSTATTTPRRTDLLRDIDFSGCDVSECDFSYCDLTGVVCSNMTLNRCTFNETVLNQGLISNVIFEQTSISDTSFDYGSLNNVRLIHCPIEHSSFNFLKELKHVTLESCPIRSVAMLGGASAEQVIIRALDIPDELPQAAENFRTDKAVVFRNVAKNNDKPAILLPWNDSTPGMSATLAERVLLSRGMQPVRMDYKPEVDAKALDKEINDLNALTQVKMKQLEKQVRETAKKIASMKAEERQKVLDADYDGTVPLAVYTTMRTVTFGLLYGPKVSEKDITEQFDAEWKKQGNSFPMLMIEIMRDEHAKDHNKFPQTAKLYEQAKSVFTDVDGVMIAGGQDIDPRFYGQKKAPETVLETYPSQPDIVDPRRDILEFCLVYMQQRASAPKPLCGICRGSQVIATAYGGTFYQDLKAAERRDFFVETIQPTPVKSDAPVFSIGSRLTLDSDDSQVLNALFFHHQGYDLSTAHGLSSVASTTTSSGVFIDVVAEHLPQNICIVQAHPEFGFDHNGQDSGAINLQLGARVAESVFGQFDERVRAFRHSQKVSSEAIKASVISSGRIFLGRNEDEDRTASISIPQKTKDYQTVCIGMGPVGLLAALSAVDRGEHVAILTDRAPDTGLTIRQQVLGVDDEAMMFVKSLVRPDIWKKYVQNNIITLHPYNVPNPNKPGEMMSLNYWYFSTGGLEKMLVDELNDRITDRCIKLSGKKDPVEARQAERSQAGIDILVTAKISPQLTADIQLSGQSSYSPDTPIADMAASLKSLRSQTLLRQKHMDIRHDEQTITVTDIQSINGAPVPYAEKRQTIGYKHMAIANGGKQAAEKALAMVFHAENVHAAEPLISNHVAVIFNLKGSVGRPPVAFDAHELMRHIEQAKKDKTSEPIKMAALREYGWTDASRPHQQIYASRANTLEHEFCYIGCEYPEALKAPAIKVAIELKLLNPAEYEKSVPIKIRQAIDSNPNKINAGTISKQLCRQWSRMLFQDALPKNICDAHITDPVYDKGGPIQIGQQQLETSQFDLTFTELDTSIVISGDPALADVSTIVSLGDGRMLPLYTTGTGFQTGAKMAMHYHNAQTALATGLAELKKKYHVERGSTKDESQQYRADYQKLVTEVYTAYHAEMRAEIDKIRGVQSEWIEKRNERVLKAASVFYVMEQATGMWERTQRVAAACNAIKGDSRQGSFFAESKEFKDIIPDKDMAAKLERIRSRMKQVALDLNKFYVQFDEHQITAYEGVPELALKKKEATVKEYYSYYKASLFKY